MTPKLLCKILFHIKNGDVGKKLELLFFFISYPTEQYYKCYKLFLQINARVQWQQLGYCSLIVLESSKVPNTVELCILTLLLPGCQTNDYSRGGGGSLGPRSYFWLVWTTFCTRETIFEQLIVKGVHHWSCRRKIFEGTLNFVQVIAVFLSNKNFSNLELKMAIAQSIFNILRSSFFRSLGDPWFTRPNF